MNNCPWKKITDFQSLSEFNRFVDWIGEEIRSGAAEDVAVAKPYLDGNTFKEKWFRHIESGKIWRLVWPDAPFHGVFEPVE
jgi:hypothetical protein